MTQPVLASLICNCPRIVDLPSINLRELLVAVPTRAFEKELCLDYVSCLQCAQSLPM
jgi:hypothetical protein